MSRPERWDIFCTVVDNFGDVGVTWRLARQLVHEFGKDVHLWIDAPEVLQCLWPAVDATLDRQQVCGVTVQRWHDNQFVDDRGIAVIDGAIDVVIEAFACHLPEPVLAALATAVPPPVWLNLEYLSAEDWVEDCHGLPSIHPQLPLTKYFFFPGFTARTGGLLRERELLAQRHAFQRDPQARRVFLANLGVEMPEQARVYSLFSYESPALAGWLDALAGAEQPVLCLIPEGRPLPQVAGWLQVAELRAGDRHQRGALTVHVLPFLQQDVYDRLLWCCDFNVVRGEDSFVRAIWAGRPFCWQIYQQADAAHLHKLEAFLSLYTSGFAPELAAAVRAAMKAWSGEGDGAAAWSRLETQWPQWQAAVDAHVEGLAARADLASALVEFCEAHRQSPQ